VFSHIFPFLIGDSQKSVFISEKLKEAGYYALPIRPPTVPEGSARIRISLTAQLTVEEVKSLADKFIFTTFANSL
jgi:8-amino-7-oxononanoate synthase